MTLPNDWPTSTDRRSLLSEWTTLGVGGPADVLALPRTASEAAALLSACAERGVPWRALGKGSNLLVGDEGVRGVVVSTRDLRSLDWCGEGRVRAGAGVATSVLLQEAMRRRLGGLECLVGYPASIGGAARMNAGGRWGEVKERIEAVVVIDGDGTLREIPAAECGFGYRRSALAGRLVVEVVLALPEAEPRETVERIRAIQREKGAAQPLGLPSAGCFFRNPPGSSAGRLIDEAGLKGRAVGGAVVSDVHGNFLVNRGGATASDFLRLVDEVRSTVARVFGVDLVLEVEVWGAGSVPARA